MGNGWFNQSYLLVNGGNDKSYGYDLIPFKILSDLEELRIEFPNHILVVWILRGFSSRTSHPKRVGFCLFLIVMNK